jgi:small conductance mechanosensitive channel
METQAANVVAATRTAFTQAGALAVSYGLSIVGAIILLTGGWVLSGMASRSAYRVLSRIHGVDETLARFFENVLHYGLLMLVFVTVLGQFGVQTTSIVAALGAAGLAIGLALQGTLQNIAAGIMLLILRPFQVGDYIETAAIKGFVGEIGLFATEMKTDDGLFLMAPNSTLWNTPIVNHSREPDRRQQLSIAVANDVDIGGVKKIVEDVLSAETRVKRDRPPRVYSDNLTADKTTLMIEYWATTGVWTETRHDLIDALKTALAKAGIELR